MRGEKSNQRIWNCWIGIFSEVKIIQNKIVEENITVTSRILNYFFILKNAQYIKLSSLLEKQKEKELVVIIFSIREITFSSDSTEVSSQRFCCWKWNIGLLGNRSRETDRKLRTIHVLSNFLLLGLLSLWMCTKFCERCRELDYTCNRWFHRASTALAFIFLWSGGISSGHFSDVMIANSKKRVYQCQRCSRNMTAL